MHRLVNLTEVGCFISRDESFSRTVDFSDVLLKLVLKFVVLASKFDILQCSQ